MTEIAKATNLALQRLVTESDNCLTPSNEAPPTPISNNRLTNIWIYTDTYFSKLVWIWYGPM